MRNERKYLVGDFHCSNSHNSLIRGIIFLRCEVSIEADVSTNLIDQLCLLHYVESFL